MLRRSLDVLMIDDETYFADKMTRSQQRRQVASSRRSVLSAKCLVIKLVVNELGCQQNVQEKSLQSSVQNVHVSLSVCLCGSDALRDALAQVKELSRQIPELHAVKVQLETERDSLRTEVSDLTDALKDALARLDAANNQLTQLRTELERRLHEKDEEIDGIRSVNHAQWFSLKYQ